MIIRGVFKSHALLKLYLERLGPRPYKVCLDLQLSGGADAELGEADSEDAVLEAGLGLGGVGVVGNLDGSRNLAEVSLHAVDSVDVHLGHLLAVGLDDEDAFVDGDVEVLLRNAWKIDQHVEVIGRLHQISREKRSEGADDGLRSDHGLALVPEASGEGIIPGGEATEGIEGAHGRGRVEGLKRHSWS